MRRNRNELSAADGLHETARHWDCVVVGAGPAGAVAAYGMARRGTTVLLADRAAFPRQKVCGCCLNPEALANLGRAGLGDLPAACGAVPLMKLCLAARGRRAELPLTGWAALSRERFDFALVQAAQRAGAVFMPETHVRLGVVRTDARVCILGRATGTAEVSAALVLAADGLGGQLLARSAPGAVRIKTGSRIGAGVVVADNSPEYEPCQIYMACGTSGYVGLVRLEDGRLNVAAAFDAGFLRSCGRPGIAAARVLAEVGLPMIRDLAHLHWHGTPPLTRTVLCPAAERLLALGDAAGYVEPFTGQGIAWALDAAVAVVPLAIRGWNSTTIADWVRWHRRRRQRLIRAVAWTARHPRLASAVIRLAGAFPGVGRRVLDRLFNSARAGPLPPPSRDRTPVPSTAPGRAAASSALR